MNRPARALVITVTVFLIAILALSAINGPGKLFTQPKHVEYNVAEFENLVLASKDTKWITEARWQDNEISGKLEGGRTFSVVAFPSTSDAGARLYDTLRDKGVPIRIERAPMSQSLVLLLSTFGPMLLFFLAIYFFFIKPAQQGGNQAMSFGRSKARRVGDNAQKVTFDDVAGIEEAKQELFEIVDFLRNTKKYVALGAKIPKGILLTGPPGVGKTYLARAIAGEAGVPFFHISGSDFVEMFVGVGAARVRDLFETAKAHRPCLIFVDEIDAVGRQRGAGLGGGHDEREQTLNQLLVEMDGFDPNTGVIMIAATNRPDVLDPALLRPGRFDRQVVVDPPDAKGREAILKIHAKGKPLDSTVALDKIAKRSPGFSGADLANALNEAALLAARRDKTKIGMGELEDALDRVMVGAARVSRTAMAKDREITAYHEAGHAVIGELLEHCDPIHKVTILPRGMALGITWSLPDEESLHVSRSELLDDITMTLGGLVAEEVVYGERWTGASSDLDRVTRIARAMICEFGMSDKLGTLAIGRRSRSPFLGRDAYEDRDYSEDVAKMIDEEARDIVERCHQRATEIVLQHREKLDALVVALLDRETLDRDEFLAVINGRELPDRPEPTDAGFTPTEPDSEGEIGGKRVSPPRFEPGPA